MRRRRIVGIALFGSLLLLSGVVLVSTSWLASFGGTPDRARMERSPNYVDGKFQNVLPTSKLSGSMSQMIEDQLGDEPREPQGEVPVVRRAKHEFDPGPPSGARATWIGHASVLLELGAGRVLFDPIFSERCSPFSIAGPKRFAEPPIAIAELPRIDAVVISHDHYDHLDMESVKALAPRGPKFVVPLGIGAHLAAWGVAQEQIAELDWNESASVAGLELTAVPSRHYSGRTWREDPTLWASWVATSSSARVFFSGDTGYFDGFRKTGERYGPFTLTIIKIGAYGRTWPEIHMTPEEAVQAHLDLGGRVMLPIHWGTFNLAPHAYREPAVRVLAAARERGVMIAMPRPGEMVDPAEPPPVEEWWSAL